MDKAKRRLKRAGLQCVTASVCAVLFSVASVPQAHAVRGCKPDIYVTNHKATAIKVMRFEYKGVSNTIYSEGITNKRLSGNETEDWQNQRLEGVAQHVPVTMIRIKFQNDTTGSGSGNWSSARWTQWFEHSGDCYDNKAYRHHIY